ncbi:hypothetical protein BpHYR1_044371 [Brachionus plicatilis]|uniref:Uncharacterized protein n=1 Tax=Brachionus plicatilis TaxID=10195 RepID=A0A3M7ST56_BRAPC|nr:hypothetical protein BpHYR1_044371 [Brachionus plicatilis]
MLNKDHSSVYTELTNYPSNYNQSYLIVQNSTFRNICANKGCTYKKKKLNWPAIDQKPNMHDDIHKKITNKFRKLRRSSTIRDSGSASSKSVESEHSKDTNRKSKKFLGHFSLILPSI